MEDKEYLYKKNGMKGDEDEIHHEYHGLAEAAASIHTQAKIRKRFKKHQKDIMKRMSQFERRYSKLAREKKLIHERKRIDFVLVYPNKKSEDVKPGKEKRHLLMHEENRRRFEALLQKEGFSIQYDTIGELVYLKLHCPFKRLCAEAERIHLEMPIKGAKIEEVKETGRFAKFIEKHFETDDEADFVSAQFFMDRISMFEDYENPTQFFRPAQRSFLTHHILCNLDIRTREEITEGYIEDDDHEEPAWWQKGLGRIIGTHVAEETPKERKASTKVLKKKGLPFLLMKKNYTDAFILHEDSVLSWKKEEHIYGDDYFTAESDVEKKEMPVALTSDPRRELDETWTRFFKFQPLWKVRKYFGEKIAFYFAWSGELITSLWIPTLFGLIIFIYGLVQSVEESTSTTVADNATFTEEVTTAVKDLLSVIKLSFDNDVTPFFALVICLWGTVFLEVWKRKKATLAYEWDVDEYEAKEPDRPQYFGTKVTKDPVTSEDLWYYPVQRHLLKFAASASVLIFMICLVLASVFGVIVYRVIMDVDMCPNLGAAECLLLTTVLSSVLNAVSILLLGKLYDKLAIKLTDWENHRTETRYNDALIIKLFGFQFVNSYTSCLYIAFFRGRFDVLGRGSSYRDSCSGTCMSQLSFQVLVLMILKPFPKFFKDIILPFVKKRWRRRPNCLRCRKNQVDETSQDKMNGSNPRHQTFMENERLKPDLGDFTLSEYTEKVIMYGFLMLFAASFPLAPLLALITVWIDIRVDAKRILWWYRRPVAFIAQDIGMWYDILTFVNFAGVLSNAFLIAFTSSWGQGFSLQEKLWIVIGFEHIVFVLKFILAYMIPDVPAEVRLAIRREKFQVAALLEENKPTKVKSMDYKHLFPPEAFHASDVIEENDDDAGGGSGGGQGDVQQQREASPDRARSDSRTDCHRIPCASILTCTYNPSILTYTYNHSSVAGLKSFFYHCTYNCSSVAALIIVLLSLHL
ncbi:anoctamin-7-like [Gigantopelta aegis]|uniref:anoctamin-7-like n=1 Tax=Gigantopelta aegis TaxID=1735272 RepID=UPI001B88BC49|nr:anoctamin-7-like [Gigantopelta aegis]